MILSDFLLYSARKVTGSNGKFVLDIKKIDIFVSNFVKQCLNSHWRTRAYRFDSAS